MRRVSTVILTIAFLLSLTTDAARAEKPDATVVNSKDEAMAAVKAAESNSSRPIKDKWAVIIGVDRFQDKRIPTLRFSAKDARDFAKFLVEKANFKEDHVILLLNENATRHNIYSALGDTWLPRLALEDDLVLIYASSHGSPREIDVGGDNFLIAYDTKQDELFTSGIRLKDLAPTIKQRTHCDRVVLILDACNSGAAQAGGKGLFRSTNFDVSALAGKGQIVISSSSVDQRSWESKRYQNGVFTRKLIEVLDKKGQKTDLFGAFDNLKDRVEQEVRFDRKAFQTPVLHSKWQGEQLIITAKPSSPRDVDEEAISPFTYKVVVNQEETSDKNASASVIDEKPQVSASTKSTPATVSSAATSPVETKLETKPTPVTPVTPVEKLPDVVSGNSVPSATSTSDLPSYGNVETTQKKVVTPAPTGEEVDMWMKFKTRWNGN